MFKPEEKRIDPRFRLHAGQRWHRGARVVKQQVAPKRSRK